MYCVNNTPTTNCPNGQFCDGQRMLLYVYKLETDELVLSSNGTFTRTESYKYAPVDWAASACGALAYKNSNTTRQETGGWSYDATTKSLYTIIDNNGGPGLETFTYRKNEVLETKGNQFILKDEYNTFEYTKK
ncbi:hypothetical protein MKQ70_35050 [Chitinophaga sedimenti]|uniref:hypothetical protein n=1 Tax=Chitinophaga sedimenti TaxID=2033606 RepID=UPI0020044FC3|nr:hypothetical protein [Chitinophaga sedimenti]MCK7559877.1 hypothetical protein [Chitinophaga sedimenti]